MHRIAILEDEPELGEYFLQLFRQQGYDALLFPTAGRFFDWMIKNRVEAALLDMNLPGMHGREVIRVLRSNPETKGMLLIAMSGTERKTSDVINGFKAGADEYLVKPIDADLLLVRLAALLRRGRSADPEQEGIKIGGLLVAPEERSCRLDGKDVSLTRLEFDLLLYFLRQAGRVLTRGVLLESVWQGDPGMTTRTVDKHVEALRRKLGPFGRKIETVIGVGYLLKP